MLTALFIIVDDDFEQPLYADPSVENVDEDVYEALCAAITDAIEGEGAANGHVEIDDGRLVWRFNSRAVLTFAALVDNEISVRDADAYLKALTQQYMDEVDDVRNPERAGVEDVVVDVIPPWDE